MNFLERKTKVYGSSKPGTAYNYGIKMNDDNFTYSIYTDKSTPVNKDKAEEEFNNHIKNWLKQFINSSFEDKIYLLEKGHKLIKAKQLLRKIIVLEHPEKTLSIYQDEVIKNAYKYFINKQEPLFYKQNIELLSYLFEKFSIPRNKENQLRLTMFIWDYFNKKTDANLDEIKQNVMNTLLSQSCSFVQFHPSYDYTDFVEGLRPIKKENNELGFELKNGIFKDFCKKAKNDPNNRYVFIIDEINRAEISKVFGELFFSLDPGYRGQVGKVKTQYANIQTEETYFTDIENDFFYVPKNIYIIGTMNDIDRSVESFDFAMRRRFAWIEVKAIDRIEMWNGQIDNFKEEAKKRMIKLNEEIEKTEGLNSSFHIGSAYFLKLKNYESTDTPSFDELWKNHIEVLLKEYIRGLPDANNKLKDFKQAYNLENE